MKEVPLEYYPDDDEEIDYDSDGNPIAPPRSKVPGYLLIKLLFYL